MDVVVSRLDGPGADARRTEAVERKGLGHPDSLCDALAEQFSLSLSRHYLDRFGLILHHNVDKVLLWGGQAQPAFGGGKVLQPIEIFLSGRATYEHKGVKVPVDDIAKSGSRDWLRAHLGGLDPVRDVIIHSLVRPGSRDLAELYLRAAETGKWLSNDTSIGVGFAPLSRLERTVLAVEQRLTDPKQRVARPHLGEDVKVMGVRRGNRIELTVAGAFVGRHVTDLDDYLRKKHAIAAEIDREATRLAGGREVSVAVNTADDAAAGSVYLTVTGISAEAGDDGQAGRGNRVNGLITPCRPMTMESVAGKNPVTHVGKLYNIAAGLIAEAIVTEVAEIAAAEVYLVSRIGQPVTEPALVEIRIEVPDSAVETSHAREIGAIAQDHLTGLGTLWRRLLTGEVGFDRWPLRAAAPP